MMLELPLIDVPVFLVVAQRPFEVGVGVVNCFSLLIPVLHEDGQPVSVKEFPDLGYVWWMLRASTRGFAEPGRLLTATLVEAERAGEPHTHWYQAQVDRIEPVRPTQLIEVLQAPPDWVSEARQIIGRHQTLELDHPPLEQVYVSWQGCLYGPLRPAPAGQGGDGVGGSWRVHFSTVSSDHAVHKIPIAALQHIPAGAQHRLCVEVSLVDRPPSQVSNTHPCSYHLFLASAFEQMVAANPGRVVLESDEAIILREARRFLSRSKKQELTRLLDELLPAMAPAADAAEAGVTEAARLIRVLKGRLEDEGRATEELARSLLETGVLEQQLRQAEQRAEREHIEKNAARLQTEIDQRLKEARKGLDDLNKKKDAFQQDLERQRREKLNAADKEAERKIKEADRACREREEQLEVQKREIARQRNLLSGNLAQVAREITEKRDELVNQFLAIVPLLQQLNLFPQSSSAPLSPESSGSRTESKAPSAESSGLRTERRPESSALSPEKALPPFVLGGKTYPAVTEELFFDRFCKHVQASGFEYRRLDLASFHLSVKCGELTVLGGLPGTGKSSLPRLYAEALAGEEYETATGRYLHVAVSPSWLDMHDLLGHTNALDRCFQPSESGLYQFLIHAQEEEARRGLDSRIYLVTLDEMNLAQVEHYFNDFLQALERPDGLREVRCFAPELVAASDPFAPWPSLKLPRTLRFAGTVNFDETTRQLSQRVLDRANLIHLRPHYLLDAGTPGRARSIGSPITLGQFRGWVAQSAGLDASLGKLLDQLKEPLVQLGCPLTPRRFHAIRKLLGSVPPSICKPEEARDVQIAQRILPQVRNLFRPGARKALNAIRKALESQPSSFSESLQVLDEIQAGELPDDLLAEGSEE
jgi:hypothetical protein